MKQSRRQEWLRAGEGNETIKETEETRSVSQAVSQYAFLSVLLCTCGLVKRHQWQPEYMFQFKVRFSQCTVKMPGCDLILPLSGGCIRGELCVLWLDAGGENKKLTVDFFINTTAVESRNVILECFQARI